MTLLNITALYIFNSCRPLYFYYFYFLNGTDMICYKSYHERKKKYDYGAKKKNDSHWVIQTDDLANCQLPCFLDKHLHISWVIMIFNECWIWSDITSNGSYNDMCTFILSQFTVHRSSQKNFFFSMKKYFILDQ